MDTSSELIHSLLPVFLVSVLGASMTSVGLIEGVAEATALIAKIFSGTISDYLGRRKALTVLGYGLAAMTKPLFLSLAKTSSDALRSTEIRQSVHRPKTPSLVGGRATGIVRPSALHGHTGVAMEDGEGAGWAAELGL
jgi:MFS family permease